MAKCDTAGCDEQAEFRAVYRNQRAALCLDDAERVEPFAEVTDLDGNEV